MHEPPFDPYHKWLGIPPKDQPPDHYRLLGLERFESDPDVIAHAADARMTHIKSLATGVFTHLSQEILNAISTARVCLLNPQSKALYDAALWEWLEQQRMAVPVPVPPPLPVEQPSPLRIRGQRVSMLVLIAVGMAGCVLLLISAIVLLLSGREPTIARQEPPPAVVEAPAVSGMPALQATESPQKPTEPPKPAIPVEMNTEGAPKAEPKPELPEPTVVDTPDEKEPPSISMTSPIPSRPVEPEVPETAKPDMQPKAPVEKDGASQPKPIPKVEPQPVGKADESPQPSLVASIPDAKRTPVPSADEQAKLQKQVDDVYKPAEATTPQKKLELAEKMFATGDETKDDPASRYVLMRSAWRLAGEAGNLELALDMIDRAQEWYQFDPLEAKVEVLERTEKLLGPGPETEATSQRLVQTAMSLVDAALRNDDFQTATRLLEKIAVPAARRTTDKQLVGELAKRRAQVRRYREEYAEVEKAKETLVGNEADGDANLTLGRWYCLAKGKWEQGLPYLAKGSDQELADLAQRELQGVTSSQAQVELADGWWELGERAGSMQKEPTIAPLRARAAHWYRQALPFLTGIVREKAEKRLADTSTTAESRGEYALEFDGWKSHALVDFGYAGTCPITIEAIVKPAVPPAASMGTVIGNFDRTDASGLMLTCQSTLWGFSFVEMQRPGRGALPPGVPQRLHARTGGRDEGWHHVAGVFDGKQLRLYVDGELQESRAISGVHKPTTKLPFVIGATPALGPSGFLLDDYFKGLIKAVRISSVARYTDNFSPPNQLARDDGNTQLLLVFNKGSGDVVADTSGRKSSPAGTGGRKRAGTSTAKLVGTNWVQLNAASSETNAPSDRGSSRSPF